MGLRSQKEIAAAWQVKVSKAKASKSASDLYAGNGFRRARVIAETHKASFFIISAGLGLVPGKRRVPSYNLSVSPMGDSSVAKRLGDSFDPDAWWRSVTENSLSLSFSQAVLACGDGLILVVLTRPYARLIGKALSRLSSANRARLRIFGAGLTEWLPESLHKFVMPYDSRLDAAIAGPKVDFSHRALEHFVSGLMLKPEESGTLKKDRQWVEKALADFPFPSLIKRKRVGDAAINDLILKAIEKKIVKTKLLRHIRHDHGVACEQSRFNRLYENAVRGS